MYKWHLQDPVSQREIVRNNESYNFQGNRNPFIDNPDYVAQIWGNGLNTASFSQIQFKLYPNPVKGNTIYFDGLSNATIQIYNIIGKLVISDKIATNKKDINISNLAKGIYLVKINTSGNIATKRLIKR